MAAKDSFVFSFCLLDFVLRPYWPQNKIKGFSHGLKSVHRTLTE